MSSLFASMNSENKRVVSSIIATCVDDVKDM